MKLGFLSAYILLVWIKANKYLKDIICDYFNIGCQCKESVNRAGYRKIEDWYFFLDVPLRLPQSNRINPDKINKIPQHGSVWKPAPIWWLGGVEALWAICCADTSGVSASAIEDADVCMPILTGVEFDNDGSDGSDASSVDVCSRIGLDGVFWIFCAGLSVINVGGAVKVAEAVGVKKAVGVNVAVASGWAWRIAKSIWIKPLP